MIVTKFAVEQFVLLYEQRTFRGILDDVASENAMRLTGRAPLEDDGPCHKLVTAPEHAPVIVATLADLKKSRSIAKEKGWEMITVRN